MTAQRTFLIIFFYIYVHFPHGNLTEDDDSCQHYTRINNGSKCDFKQNRRLVCFDGLEDKWAKDVEILILCEWPKTTLDLHKDLRKFTSLQKLIIANNNLTQLSTTLPIKTQSEVENACQIMLGIENFGPYSERAYKDIIEVNVTGTKSHTSPEDAFNLKSLKYLDLRNNSLEEINATTFNMSTLEHVRLAGNLLRCTEDIAWILDPNEGSAASKVVDKDKLLCATPYDGKPLLPIVEIIAALKEECKQTVCDCKLIYVVSGRAGRTFKQAQKQMIAFTSVNCSYCNLTEMPNVLPANTTTLILTGNKIKDLTPLTTNPTYKSVLDLYIDNNLIESIVQLEGSDWLDHFRLLNLRGNKLTDLPTYALENALLHNRNVAGLYLGNNSWTCDCHFTPSFQDLLIRHSNLIKDINDIKCTVTSDSNNNSNKQIRDLTRIEICILPDEDSWLHPLDILNIVLASLIFLVLGKFLYDYWSFKTTGKLPWIVTKIP